MAKLHLKSSLRLFGIACVLVTVSFGSDAEELRPESLEHGQVLIASAEGLSVFERDGAMPFGHFVTAFGEGHPKPLDWDDMVYDGWQLPSGNYLYSSHRYVRELDPHGTLVWEYRLPAPNELKTCVPLPNGDVMTVDAERMELVQLTDQGRREVRRILVPTSPEASIHNRYNLLRRTPAGTFLLALRHEKVFIEVDESGKELWRHPVPELPVVAERLMNGNTLMSWMHGLIEVAPDHSVVWELNTADITEFPVIIFGGFHRFDNGNTLIANSDWHYKEAGQNRVQVFEVNRDKEVVWTLTTEAFAGKKPGSLEPSTGFVEQRIIGLQWLEAANETIVAKVDEQWDAIYRDRLTWWSLQPIASPPPPSVQHESWPRNEVDQFILAALEAEGLAPVREAEARTLARRLSFALTGLPPKAEAVERFAADPSAEAYDALVQSLLDSPHFGERWARHWMDVVHYSDTHGYEWDTPAKNAWMYRDYLIRAYNTDVSYQQLVMEQLAGDLIEPRVDPSVGLNEAIIGPMALRLGERRHGDNSQTEGVTQEAVSNAIDTLSKAFIATTVACAQCHDHKLDAVAQRDYYSLAGTLMSSRWGVRSAEAGDPNGPVIEELRAIKQSIREEMGTLWSTAQAPLVTLLSTPPVVDAAPEEKDEKKKVTPASELPFPETLPKVWDYVMAWVAEGSSIEEAWGKLPGNFRVEREKRNAANAHENLRLLADFTGEEIPAGWQVDGLGMKYGLVQNGAMVIADEGDGAVAQLLPAGRWSHVWSKRLAGAVRSPLFSQDPPPTISLEYAGGDYAAQSLIVDNAFHSERMGFLNKPSPGWLTFTGGHLEALAGGPDMTPRQVYLELVTKSLNNYYPPRSEYGHLKQAIEHDPRSWFGVTRAYEHEKGHGPVNDLARFEALLEHPAAPTTQEALAERLVGRLMTAVEQWRTGACDREDLRLINEALQAKWLPNSLEASPALAQGVAQYRETEKRLQPARVVGSADDWHEGRDARIGVRGSYSEFGDAVPRGTISFLEASGERSHDQSSGRLELAQNFASENNPLVPRVYVNRVWHHLFGAGLVRTVDDFGHLGEVPSHPELLDWIAQRFMEEGWSTKKLIQFLVTSSTWRQDSVARAEAVTADPENRLWHHMPMRRLEAEAIRDSVLSASGQLDTALYGPPINPYRVSEDSTKRLYAGPLDGNGRRSIYQKMTLMEPPRFLALFNQPIPKLTTGARDTTNVPDQALAMLNDPFVVAMAQHWSEAVLADDAASPEERVAAMFKTAFSHPPAAEDTARFVRFAKQSAQLRGVETDHLLKSPLVWQDVAHALFNLKEFMYVQ